MAVGIIRDQLADLDNLSARMERAAPLYVFPAPGGRAPVGNSSASKATKHQDGGGDDGTVTTPGAAPWTPRDLRRTAATFMEEPGIPPFHVAHVLNHVSVTRGSVTSKVCARYDYSREKREALNLWADRLQGIIAGKPKVVSIGRTARKSQA